MGGASIQLDTADLGQLLSFEEICVDSAYDLSLVPFAPDVVLDCGAHVGLFSMLALHRFPKARLVAFEPNPRNAEQLRSHLLAYGTRAEVREVAVSVYSGESQFTSDQSNSGHLVDLPRGGWTVTVEDLPAFVAALGNARQLIKLDVEGEELRIIPALAPCLAVNAVIFFETHGAVHAWQLAVDILRRAGFVVTCLRDRGQYRDGIAVRTN
jgi:FkbM family methyltransferase